jgi:hypothetical protein
MQYPNIEEMPIPHDEPITIDQIPEVVSYCWNDVDSTYTFFTKVKYETDVRLSMAKEYKVDIVNASEPRMVREIFATFITKQMGITYQELKKLRTVRKYVAFKDIIFPYVDFKTKQLQDVLALFKETAVNTSPTYKPPVRIKGQPKPVDESKFEHVFDFHGMDVVLGLGGIHACAGPGVYTHEEDEVIEDADGTSFYPMLAIKNGLRPEHLGESFNTVYPMMFEERKKYGKKDPRNYIFKIILNSAYGLSKEINGYLYDPKFTYAITINGQLSLLMLAEALSMSVPDIKFIQMNTDGLTYKYKKVHEPIVRKICQWWEKTTKIDLEYAYYSKMVFRDVNNYMAVDTQGGVKKKGIFETAVPYHKDPSSLIIRKALEEYFINDLTPEQYISRPEHSIFDFCNGVKKTHDFKLNLVRYLGASKDPTFTSQQEIKDFLAEHGWHEQFVADNWVHGDNNHGMAGMPMRSALESAIKHSRTERGAVEMVEELHKHYFNMIEQLDNIARELRSLTGNNNNKITITIEVSEAALLEIEASIRKIVKESNQFLVTRADGEELDYESARFTRVQMPLNMEFEFKHKPENDAPKVN